MAWKFLAQRCWMAWKGLSQIVKQNSSTEFQGNMRRTRLFYPFAHSRLDHSPNPRHVDASSCNLDIYQAEDAYRSRDREQVRTYDACFETSTRLTSHNAQKIRRTTGSSGWPQPDRSATRRITRQCRDSVAAAAFGRNADTLGFNPYRACN